MPSDHLNAILDSHAASLYDAGKLDDAIRVAGTALSNARQAMEDDPENAPLLVTGLERLANLQQEAGDFEKAESLYLEALDTAEKTAVRADQMARLHSRLATLYDFSQREEAAIPLYEQAIRDYEQMNPPRGQESAQLRNNLAMIYKSLGRHALAEQHYLQALEALEKIYGRENERVAAVFNNLGSLYYSAGFADQAKEMHLEALEMRIKVFGADHPEVAQSYCNLATACYELQDDAGTMENYEQSLRILELHLPTEVDSYEQIAADYAAVLESLGEDRRAQAVRRRTEKLLRR